MNKIIFRIVAVAMLITCAAVVGHLFTGGEMSPLQSLFYTGIALAVIGVIMGVKKVM
ncbi:hypothetical protein K8O68_10735 [Salipaludibacillus sp. CUR1]|uniref:hypothetical protein n=1 Tax=Salipaludibacillus sp. CUR1 TaxID=2820003 RepID=UPI001E364238|nr:hypothetical protein [Salipaludibacillus sp. CUR1]MCE7792890.1 hypothetical protein [Salipaludibacillus sp. CUR1]